MLYIRNCFFLNPITGFLLFLTCKHCCEICCKRRTPVGRQNPGRVRSRLAWPRRPTPGRERKTSFSKNPRIHQKENSRKRLLPSKIGVITGNRPPRIVKRLPYIIGHPRQKKEIYTYLCFFEGFKVWREVVTNPFGRSWQRNSPYEQNKEDDVREKRREPDNLRYILFVCVLFSAGRRKGERPSTKGLIIFK